MERRVTGKSVLITNVKGTNFSERKGCDKDLDNLKKVFSMRFGFSVLNENKAKNITMADWNHENCGHRLYVRECTCIACRIKKANYEADKYFLLVISSHGGIYDDKLSVKLSDGKGLPIEDVISALSIAKLNHLTKIIIICACRGKTACVVKAH